MNTWKGGLSKLRRGGIEYNGSTLTPETPPAGPTTADLGLLLMALIWGVNFPVIKAALTELEPLAFNALRFPLAGLTVLILLRKRGAVPWPSREDWPRIVALGILGNVVYQGFFIFGMNATMAGNASILLATTPAWTMALSTVRRHERPGPWVWFGVLATLTGMALVVLGGNFSLSIRGATLPGDLLIVGAAITWSTYSVGSRRMIQKYGSLKVTAWTLWVGTGGLFLIGLPSLVRAPLAETSTLAWGGVAYSGVLAIGMAYLLWYRGVQLIGNARTAAYSNITPIIALAVAWAWLGEIPSGLQITGAAVVLTGLSLARLGGERK
ncbi:DMT family transporter [Gemmatimonadota bacterium]